MIWFMAPDLPEASGGTRSSTGSPRSFTMPAIPRRSGTERVDSPTTPSSRARRSGTGSPWISTRATCWSCTRWAVRTGRLPGREHAGRHALPGVVLPLREHRRRRPAGCGLPGVAARDLDVLATSQYVERTVRAVSGDLPVHRVPVVVDPAIFKPSQKRRTVAFMPRRRSLEITAALQILRRRGQLAGWTFEPIDGLTERQVGGRLGEAAIYVSGAEREGFGLPAAEAMAAGCYVVGFTGDGGAEFMDPTVCTVVHDSDVLSSSTASLRRPTCSTTTGPAMTRPCAARKTASWRPTAGPS